jgi:alanine racemase
MAAEGAHRPAWAEIDLSAIRHNAAVLAALAAPARLCAVVKADAYGHSAVPVAKAALRGGAAELAVALVDEGIELRDAGVAAPILLLSEPSADAMEDAVAAGLVPTVYTAGGVSAARAAARRLGRRVPVEVKVDTGMHRVGAAPAEVAAVVSLIAATPELSCEGLWTHLAVADHVEDAFTTEQLSLLAQVRDELAAAGLPAVGRVHAANSAGAIAWPATRLDMVRCGIALYGYVPADTVRPALETELERIGLGPLQPVMSWRARVTMAREYDAGERISYGRVAPLAQRSVVATVPLGYADGVVRGYFPAGGEVLIGGSRCPLAGTVTMDQLLVACSPEAGVKVGDEVVLIGRQGEEAIWADEWARRLNTISYEIVTRVGARVPRVLTGRG